MSPLPLLRRLLFRQHLLLRGLCLAFVRLSCVFRIDRVLGFRWQYESRLLLGTDRADALRPSQRVVASNRLMGGCSRLNDIRDRLWRNAHWQFTGIHTGHDG
ncbi:hypothetical protein B0H21DRAFT_757640 [Amylocystis lapponica]|nr:hypothetical protein B0H21DRAFT_757640 [Amylocystis lapponica]